MLPQAMAPNAPNRIAHMGQRPTAAPRGLAHTQPQGDGPRAVHAGAYPPASPFIRAIDALSRFCTSSTRPSGNLHNPTQGAISVSPNRRSVARNRCIQIGLCNVVTNADKSRGHRKAHGCDCYPNASDLLVQQ